MPAFSSLQYSLIGFTDTRDIGKWSGLLLHWLPTFDPVVLLQVIRRIDSEAPTGGAKEAWAQCQSSHLLKQTVTRDSNGDIVSNASAVLPAHYAGKMPPYLISASSKARHKQEQAINGSAQLKPDSQLDGSWRSLVCKAKRELEDLNANM